MAGGQPAHTATAGGSGGGGSAEAGAADGAAVSRSFRVHWVAVPEALRARRVNRRRRRRRRRRRCSSKDRGVGCGRWRHFWRRSCRRRGGGYRC
eukprot:COSAG01_NODE_5939_length_3941_cov_35.353462_7_plen_94_part_00